MILEASGASWGMVPLPEGFLAGLRAATQERGVVLILDEVITGFRWSRGGAQARFRVIPDLCVLAKIVAGGLPGGAVCGRADIMDQLDPAAAKAAGREKIGHQGTFNANPLCAAAAVATLSIVERDEVCARAEATAEDIRSGMRQILSEEDVPWGIYGDASAFLIFQNPKGLDIDPQTFDPLRHGFKELKAVRDANLSHRLRIAMLANGVDIMGAPGGLVSAVHGPDEVGRTLDAFRTSVRWLKAEGDIAADAMIQPLSGVLVLDFTTLLPGPLATLMLAEAGAEVIKIERPGGEDMRVMPPRFDGEAAVFALLNRGKKSLTLDLKNASDRSRLRPLLEKADVVVEQFRPGVMERLDLGYEAVARSIRASSIARSRATASRARAPARPATTSTTRASPACSRCSRGRSRSRSSRPRWSPTSAAAPCRR